MKIQFNNQEITLPPEWTTDIEYFVKSNCWMLVAWWKGQVWDELHWDYVFVGTKDEGEELLEYIKSGFKS